MKLTNKLKFALIAITGLLFSCDRDEAVVNHVDVSETEAVLKTIRIGKTKFQYQEFSDGLKCIEGDIVVSDEMIDRLKSVAAKPNAKLQDFLSIDEMGRPLSNFRSNGSGDVASSPFLSGTYYYYINPDIPEQHRITDAIQAWDTKLPFLDFVRLDAPRPDNGPIWDWVEFVRHNSTCASTIPNYQSNNTIHLANECDTERVIHEIGHSLGLFHEHQRVDRDLDIIVYWDNIPMNQRSNYRLSNTLILENLITTGYQSFVEGPVDFSSIMIYNSEAVIEESRSVQLAKTDGTEWEKPGTISDNDVETVRRIFQDDISNKLMFTPSNFVITKEENCTYNLSWDHVGGIPPLTKAPDEFWLYIQNSDGEWELQSKVTGANVRSAQVVVCSSYEQPGWMISAANAADGSFSAAVEGTYE